MHASIVRARDTSLRRITRVPSRIVPPLTRPQGRSGIRTAAGRVETVGPRKTREGRLGHQKRGSWNLHATPLPARRFLPETGGFSLLASPPCVAMPGLDRENAD